MRLKVSVCAGVAISVLATASLASPVEARKKRSEPAVQQDASVLVDEAPRLGDPYEIDGKRYEPRDDVTYDDVGYAGVIGNWNGSGLPPMMVAILHKTLPVPSHVELTNLETGKTILARVVDRGPMSNARLADMSPAAAELLGASSLTPIRVRRVNPPMAERAALRTGKAAPARLDTPPALLSALRRKLSETPGSSMAEAAKAAPDKATPAKVATAPKPVKGKPAPRRGADFENAGPMTPAMPASAPAIEANRKGRFIVEQAGRPSRRTQPAPAAPPEMAAAPAPMLGTTVTETVVEEAVPVASRAGDWFIQIGSFADRSYAESLASEAEAQVHEGGDYWRVRFGPFASRDAASAALGRIKSKGYPQARVTR